MDKPTLVMLSLLPDLDDISCVRCRYYRMPLLPKTHVRGEEQRDDRGDARWCERGHWQTDLDGGDWDVVVRFQQICQDYERG